MVDEQAPNAGADAGADTNAQADAIPGSPGRLREEAPNATPITTLRQIKKPCLMNMQYHAARESHLDRVHRWLMFGVIVLGASAIIDIDPDRPYLRACFAAAVTIFGALDLTFDLSNRARSHAMMRRCYGDILSAAERDPDALKHADSRLSDLAGEEEPAFQALLTMCHNLAETQVYGDNEEHLRVPAWHRAIRNIYPFPGHCYDLANPKEQARTLASA